MERIVVFFVAFALLVFAVLMLMGKIDFMLANYRLALIDRKFKFVKRREYDKGARPFLALMFFLISLFLILVYSVPSIAEYLSYSILCVALPIAILLELKYRKK